MRCEAVLGMRTLRQIPNPWALTLELLDGVDQGCQVLGPPQAFSADGGLSLL